MSRQPWRHLRAVRALRDETMAEQPDRRFAETPAPVSRPQRGQLGSVETRAHTGDRVVPGDRIAAEEPQPLARPQRGRISSRLAGSETIRPARNQFPQPPPTEGPKMVQEQDG